MKRQLVLLSGDHAWALSVVHHYLDLLKDAISYWVKDDGESILGQEVDVLVLDAYEGLNPDLVGQAAGALRGGGCFFILAPTQELWPEIDDPFNEKLQAANSEAITTSRFILRFSRILERLPELIHIRQGDDLPDISLLTSAQKSVFTANDDQQKAIDAVKHVVTGHRRRPLVLLSDRGRGKSAAFGIAAAQLVQAGLQTIIVTGPSFSAVESLFNHAAIKLDNCSIKGRSLKSVDSIIRYIAADQLLQSDIEPDLLLVDEAAALPVEILKKLLKRFPRIAFATTVHGYEGTGQGFLIRFSAYLDKHTRGWCRVYLSEPVRWAKDDLLEQQIFELLLLNAEPSVIESNSSEVMASSCEIYSIPQDVLLENEPLLTELFGLLILAHYRTRPFDLRYLLDANDLSIYIVTYEGAVVGAALVNQEGGFDEAASKAISEGLRRPQGHLLPEVVASHYGQPKAAMLVCSRIMRIAILPSLQWQGLGSALLRYIIDAERSKGIDYMGNSFGATESLLRFWKKQGFAEIRVGVNRGSASGEHSVAMILPFTDRSRKMFDRVSRHFSKQFTFELTDAYKNLDPVLVREMLVQNTLHHQDLSVQERFDLQGFCQGNRLYEACSASLASVGFAALSVPGDCDVLTDEEALLVVTKVMQQRSWQEVAGITGLTGRNQIVKKMRLIFQKLLSYSS
ncbi:MAG: GNAT family N-acetyltransferase [Gammaproteobacteria bacterium]